VPGRIPEDLDAITFRITKIERQGIAMRQRQRINTLFCKRSMEFLNLFKRINPE
ncbi:uncharacterized protein METZ01_LOCUS253724, partial [marine metagenome]